MAMIVDSGGNWLKRNLLKLQNWFLHEKASLLNKIMPRRKFEVNCYHILGKHSPFLPETSALGKLVELQVEF